MLHLHCMNWVLDMTAVCVCVFCFLAAAVVCQQGVWRADRHWATVSQSLVHSPSLPQLWPLLCWFTRHDKGEGTASVCVFACNVLCSCTYHHEALTFSSTFLCLSSSRSSSISGQCWWESRHLTLALSLLTAGYILLFHLSDIIVNTLLGSGHLHTWYCPLPVLNPISVFYFSSRRSFSTKSLIIYCMEKKTSK